MLTRSHVRRYTTACFAEAVPLLFTQSLLKTALGEHKWKRLLLACGVLCSHVATCAYKVQYFSNGCFHLCSPNAFFTRALRDQKWKRLLLRCGVACLHVATYACTPRRDSPKPFPLLFTQSPFKIALGEQKWKWLLPICGVLCSFSCSHVRI